MYKSRKRISLLTTLLAGAIALVLFHAPVSAQPAAPTPGDVPAAPPDSDAPDTPDTPEEEPPPAPTGPSEADMAKAKEHFLKGSELFTTEDYEGAVDEFKESYKLSKNAVLLYNIAYTHDQIGDKQMATFYYEKFLRDTDKGAANRKEARKALKALKATAGNDTTPDLQTVTAFKHSVIDESPPNTPLDIVAIVPEGVPWRVIVNYRPAGDPKFVAVEMHYRFKELVARIPASQTRGKNIQYYIEVRDGSGKVLERSGQPTSPHIVYMEAGAKPRFYADAGAAIAPTPTTTPLISGAIDPTANNHGDGWLDAGSSKFNNLKWGTTGTAVGLLMVSTIFYVVSANYSNELEAESAESRDSQCPTGPPCKQYAQKQKDLFSLGQTYETLGSVALGFGVATAAAAGALWYLDMSNDETNSTAITTVPVVGSDFIGAAASMRF